MDKMIVRLKIIGALFLCLSTSDFLPENCKSSPGTIDCRNASLEKITFNFNGNLKVLYLSFNLISFLDNAFFNEVNVSNLLSVYLNDNYIRFVQPETFKWLEALRHLYLQNNHIDRLHKSSFQNNINLVTLDLSGNRIVEINLHMFESNPALLWVNVVRNQLSHTSVQPTVLNSSLNMIDIEVCNNTKTSINSFQNIPYLKQLNHKETKAFTMKEFMSQQSIKAKETSSDIYVYSKLIKFGYNESTILRYDATQNVIFSPSNTSLMFFCIRLSTWFLCNDETFSCAPISGIHSLLNCNGNTGGISTIGFRTSLSYLPTSPPKTSSSRAFPTEADVNYEDQKTLKNNTRSVPDPSSEPVHDDHNLIYIIIGVIVGVLCVIVFIVVARYFIKRCKVNTRRGREEIELEPKRYSGITYFKAPTQPVQLQQLYSEDEDHST